MDRFKGKTALITGGTTGIGLATAKLFINEGARVIVTGRAAAMIKSAQAELGDNAIVVRSDATSFPDMDALAAKVKETFGKLDAEPEREGTVFHRPETGAAHAGRKFGGLYHFDGQREGGGAIERLRRR
jgi:NADPH:quinone reductase-like Zn-dependent oxidoreductase